MGVGVGGWVGVGIAGAGAKYCAPTFNALSDSGVRRAIETIEAIVAMVAIEVIGYIVVAELPLRGIEGH